jgi:[ribosomal protein S18]-alanine N-acetyltransferase
MHVRPAEADEAGEIARQIAVSAAEGWIATEPPVDLEERAARVRETIEGDGGAMFVAEDDGLLIGHAGLHPSRGAGVYTFGMSVLPEARGKGAGRMLVETLIEHARSLGAHKIELEVWTDNARAISLYATTGFEVEGLKRDHYRRKNGSLRSALLMARRI